MKNARIQLLTVLTCVFAAFVLGLFAGRNLNRKPVQIQALPDVTAAATQLPEESTPVQPPVVNINTAASAQLQTLPGIGPVIAERIIAYREEFGGFETVGELMNVPGIGEKKLEAIWDLVTTGG